MIQWTSVLQRVFPKTLLWQNHVLTYLSSDQSPVLITLKVHARNQEKQPSLTSRHTNWDDFSHLINKRLTSNVSLNTEEDIEATVKFCN
jgi:hypothetical protein